MDDDFDIAIIGLACRFPGARNAEEFWRNLAAGVESITRLSDDDIRRSGETEAHLTAPNYVKAAPILDDPGAFDAAFFGCTPGEARTMDPQHRILLELAHEALEDAGCDPSRASGRIGVFTGAAMNTYFSYAGLSRHFSEDYIPTLIANDKDFLSTRISYKLDLKGPSITVQTACSTSLVAVHLARQSLLNEESDLAVAGAISVRVPHRAGYFADPGGVCSPDGHVRAFAAGANGTVFGSGGGIVVLKRLRDAVADGDTIRAVIKGSAINNDGAEKAGYTAPSVNSQADAIVEALANADVAADSISYLEAHGSGTPVGDPIEVRALTKAFRVSTQRTGFCALGSVKTNVGHLDAAAGMAGLIKTVLAMQHAQIPPSLHFSAPNPEIDFAATPFFVATELTPWLGESGPRRAGLMATGMGGTNAHVVLEEAPAVAARTAAAQAKFFPLSARTETARASVAENLRDFLDANPDVDLNDAAFTLQIGRRAMTERRFIVAADRAGAIAALAAKPPRMTVGRAEGASRRLVLLLPGVGDQYVGMGRELYAAFPIFAAEVDRCAEILHALLGRDIREILWPKNRDWTTNAKGGGIDLKKMLAGNSAPAADEDTTLLQQAENLQPALFTIEFALARLWLDLGARPDAIVGHSMGEYVAACLSGVFRLEDALHLIARRAQFVAALPTARMLAVTLAESDLRTLLPATLSIALINGPNLCVIAGPPAAVADFERVLTARGVACRSVQNTHAFHSRLLDPVVGAFEQEVRKFRLHAPRISFVSNVTGKWITAADATDPAYWAKHLNHTARFDEALATLWQDGDAILLEAGPGSTLGVLAMQHPHRLPAGNPASISSLRHHYENTGDDEFFLQAVGKLWVCGAELRWENLHRGARRRKIPLPTYPFERQIFWLERPETKPAKNFSPAAESLGTDVASWLYAPSWQRTPFRRSDLLVANSDRVLWLILSENPRLADPFLQHLRQAGAHARCLHFGERFAAGTAGSCAIRRMEQSDYLQIFRDLVAQPCDAIRMLHLSCLTENDASPCDGHPPGFFSLIFTAQAIAELNLSIPITIGCVSAAVHEVTGEESLQPDAAPTLAVCGVIPRELPNIRSFSVDLPDALAPLNTARAAQILAEFSDPHTAEVVAYRGKHRWRRTFAKLREKESKTGIASDSSPARPALRENGVYLITGGTGGIALALARHLADSYRAKIILTRRTAFPDKAQWKNSLAAQTTSDAVRETIRALLEMETLGAEVEVHTAGVADPEEMRSVIHKTIAKFGALHGVIHAAGIAHAGLLQTSSAKQSAETLSAKVGGTRVLHAALQGVDLDFLVLFSSLASLTCPFAHADYAAANSFLDAFAPFANSRSKFRTVTINWPVWKEVGAVSRLETFMGIESWKDAALRDAILTKHGIEAFEKVLQSDLAQIVVTPRDINELLSDSGAIRAGAEKVAVSRELDALVSARTRIVADPPTDETEISVANIWSGIFGIEPLGIHERFTDLGGHSLLAIQILTRIRAQFRVEITLRDFFEAPTIAQLSAVIRQKILDDIGALTDDEVRELLAKESQLHA